jgi:uncharacterized membrane protein
MAEYQARIDLDANADAVFDYLSDVANLPRYFDRMTSAERGDGEEVRVTADIGGRSEEGKAWFRVDQQDRTLSWGSEGPNDYHGRLAVTERGLGTTVAVTLSTERAEGSDIQAGLERTLRNVKDLCQADPG